MDRTPYDGWAVGGEGAKPFIQFWTRQLSAAVVTGLRRRSPDPQRASRVRGPIFFFGGLCPRRSLNVGLGPA